MGQKVHPKGFRVGVLEGWESRWFAEREYATLLHDDIRIREFIKKRLYHAGIAKIEVERAANKAKINIYTARPGIGECDTRHSYGSTRSEGALFGAAWRRGDRPYRVVPRRTGAAAYLAGRY